MLYANLRVVQCLRDRRCSDPCHLLAIHLSGARPIHCVSLFCIHSEPPAPLRLVGACANATYALPPLLCTHWGSGADWPSKERVCALLRAACRRPEALHETGSR